MQQIGNLYRNYTYLSHKKMKYIVTLLLAVLLPFVAKADNITFLDEHVKSVCVQNWDTNGDGELSMEEAATVTKLNTKFSFDNEINRFPELQYFTGLISVSTYDFYSCKKLRSIVLPSQITSIGTSAFFGCVNLQEIVIPDAVKTISDYAFNGCSRLRSVTFPEGLTTIGENAFSSCNSLQGIAIPSTVKSIALSAFWSCSSLTSITVDPANTVYDSREDCNAIIKTSTNTLQLGTVTTVIPETVTTIGPSAFYGNALLKTINIPEGVKTIDVSAFSGCTALFSVTLPSTLTSIGGSAFSGCKKLSGILLPEGLKTIGQSAFNNCTSLRKISIPSTVTTIDFNAFAGCSTMTKVAVAAAIPISIVNNVFPYCKKSTLYVPKGSRSSYLAAQNWCDFQYIVELGVSATVKVTPEPVAYYDNPVLEVSIDNDDFDTYTTLNMDITLPDGVSLARGEGGISYTLSNRVPSSGTSIDILRRDKGVYRIQLSNPSSCLNGTEGVVVTFALAIDPATPNGDYEGIVDNFSLITKEAATMDIDDIPFTVSVVSYPMGDVNHDGEVGLVDIMLLVSRVLDEEPEGFYPQNADMNFDGELTLVDIMMIVDVVLNQ